MSRRSSGGDCASRLAVRKDLFPESDSSLDADYEQRIDELASARRLAASNGLPPPAANGCLPPESKRRRPAPGGKNLNMFEAAYEDDSDEENEGVPCSVRLPLVAVPRKGGKPFSHKLSQLSSKCRSKGHSAPAAVPSGGKPRSMMGICSSTSSRKKWSSRRSERAPVYHSQIVDTNTIKIKIKKTSSTPVQDLPGSIGDIGQRRPGSGSSTRRARNSTPSSSSGEEYDPARGDIAGSITATKSRHGAQHQHSKASGSGSHSRSREKGEREESSHKESSKEKSRHGRAHGSSSGPQSPWASTVPITILQAVFEHVVASDGSLPSLVRLGMVCRLWHGVSLAPALWSNVDLAQCTRDKWKTDYKLAWLLENRLTKCRQLNLANWKIANLSWIIACIVEYCPWLCELNLTGWRRLSGDHLHELVDGLTRLQRIDLSFTSETAASSSALAANSLTYLTVAMGSRLTHLTLANNKFTALQQILNSIAAHCSSLELLDISGVRATSHPAAIPLERLQKGCTKLRIFRAANSQVVLANASTIEQMESPGFPLLEELSVACTTSCDYRLDDEALGRILRSSTALRLLDVRGCRRVTDSGLVRVPAWDLQHLFLSGCDVTRQTGSCLELICEKWSHSLLEVDFAWATATRPLDAAVEALAEKGEQSKLKILNLCGSSVSLEPVKKVLRKCPNLESLNLSSCRALPRGMKRLYTGKELQELRDNLDPVKLKAKEEADRSKKKKKKKKSEKEKEKESETEDNVQTQMVMEVDNDEKDTESIVEEAASSSTEISDKNMAEGGETPSDEAKDKSTEDENKLRSGSESVHSKEEETAESKSLESPLSKEGPRSNQSSVPIEASPRMTPKSWNLEQFSPMAQAAADTSSSTPKSESNRASGSWRQASYSPMPKPDSQNITNPSPETNKYEAQKANSSWNLDQFNSSSKHEQSQNTTESQQISKMETQRVSSNWNLDQFSPMAKQDTQPSPEGVPNTKQDVQKPSGTWGNLGQYSPMTRQDGPFSAQPSPYSAQPSPYSAQPSPYSSQQSPYSAQPSPDTSQTAKADSQKTTNSWNLGQFSPMTKQVPQFSTQQSPDPGLSAKLDAPKLTGTSWNLGQYSPMARQERPYGSQIGPYSPRPSSDASQLEKQGLQFVNRRSPSVGKFSPMMRPDCPAPSPDAGQPTLARTPQTGWNLGQFSPMPSAATMPSPDTSQVTSTGKLSGGWSVGRYSPLARSETLPAGMWSAAPLSQPGPDSHTKQWTLSQYRQETAPESIKNLQTSWNFGQFRGADALSGHSSGYTSAPAPNMWSPESGFTSGQLLLPPSTCAVKSDKTTRTAGYSVDSVGNPVTTSCAVSNIFHGPLDGLNGPSGID